MIRYVAIASAAAALIVSIVTQLAARPSPRPHMQTVTAEQVRLHIPIGWKQAPSASGTRSWREPHSRTSVTLGSLPTAGAPLIDVVRLSQEEFRRTVPGYRNARLRIRDGAVTHRFEIAGRPPLVVEQVWRRVDGTHDVVTTWVRTAQSAAPAGFGRAPEPANRG